MNVIPRRPNRQSIGVNSTSTGTTATSTTATTTSSFGALVAATTTTATNLVTFHSSSTFRPGGPTRPNRTVITPDVNSTANGSPRNGTSSISTPANSTQLLSSVSSFTSGRRNTLGATNTRITIDPNLSESSGELLPGSNHKADTINDAGRLNTSTVPTMMISTSTPLQHHRHRVDLPSSPTVAVSASSSSSSSTTVNGASGLNTSNNNLSNSNDNNSNNSKRRHSSTNRREPKLAPEIIFLIREHAKTLESISLITRKLHEIELKVDQMSNKLTDRNSGPCNFDIGASNGPHRLYVQTNHHQQQQKALHLQQQQPSQVGHSTLDTCHSSKRASTSSHSAAVPNVLSDDSGGEYGRNTNTTNTTNNTNSGDEDELLSLLDKITKCSHHIQQTQAVAAAQSNAVLHSIDGRLPSTAGSTATYLGSQYASPIACTSAVSTTNPPGAQLSQMTNGMFASNLPVNSSHAMQPNLTSNDLYQTARQTPQHLAYANQSIATIQLAHNPSSQLPLAYATQAYPPTHHHLGQLLHPQLAQTALFAGPTYLQSSLAPLTALTMQPTAYGHPAAGPMPPSYTLHHPPSAHHHPHHQPPHLSVVPPSVPSAPTLPHTPNRSVCPDGPTSPAINAILFEPNVERFLHNLDQLVNTDDRSAMANMMLMGHNQANNNAANGGNGTIGLSAIVGQSNTLRLNHSNNSHNAYNHNSGVNYHQSTGSNNNARDGGQQSTLTNWQLEKAAELLSKKERQNIDARYKLADEWLANCLARDSSTAGRNNAQEPDHQHSSHLLHHYPQHHHLHHSHANQSSISSPSNGTVASPGTGGPQIAAQSSVLLANNSNSSNSNNNGPNGGNNSANIHTASSVSSSSAQHALSNTNRNGNNMFAASYRM